MIIGYDDDGEVDDDGELNNMARRLMIVMTMMVMVMKVGITGELVRC